MSWFLFFVCHCLQAVVISIVIIFSFFIKIISLLFSIFYCILSPHGQPQLLIETSTFASHWLVWNNLFLSQINLLSVNLKWPKKAYIDSVSQCCWTDADDPDVFLVAHYIIAHHVAIKHIKRADGIDHATGTDWVLTAITSQLRDI